jgi:hypothetical protein
MRTRNDSSAIVGIQLYQDALHVGVDGPVTDRQSRGEVAIVSAAVANQTDHLELACGESFGSGFGNHD